jgi:hypothetical protein
VGVDTTIDAIHDRAEVAGLLFVKSGIAGSPAAKVVDQAFDAVGVGLLIHD